jgi:hypothetical protein
VRVLVACEFSGAVRDAFIRAGHYAVSCDLLATDTPGPHIQGDVRDHLDDGWDVMVAFPPCTHLAVSGARWWIEKRLEQAEAINFVRDLWDAPIPRVAIENPIGRLSSAWRRPDQIVQPWMFGHGETKATCLWLRGLPPLMCLVLDQGRYPRVHRESPGPDRWKRRSMTYAGLARAMAEQWGSVAEAS